MPNTLKQARMIRFDEMAIQVKDKIDNPAEAEADRYVGLEHIDPESLKIRRWGKITDVESSKIIFKSGDIINYLSANGYDYDQTVSPLMCGDGRDQPLLRHARPTARTQLDLRHI